jgi:hypothetical protein
MRDLVLDAPLFQVALALTIVVAAAALLYRIDRGNKHLSSGLRATLGVIRATALAVLVLLLFRPVLRSEQRNTTQPSLLVLQDVSQSIGEDHPEWTDSLNRWISSLPAEEGEPGAAIQAYAFGADLSEWNQEQAMSSPVTDLSTPLELIQGQWAGRPIGAVVIATDGRFNRGKNPETMAAKLGAPIHFVLLGDTTVRQDIRINQLLHNDVAGIGNQFPIEVEVGGNGYEGTVGVTLTGAGIRQRLEVQLDLSGAPAIATFLLDAKTPGIQRYTVEVEGIPGEANTENNTRKATIDVIERRKRILLTSLGPHPDRGAWSNALADNANYEVLHLPIEELVNGDFAKEEDWDAVYFFGFDPGNQAVRSAYANAKEVGLPVGLIVDPRADFEALAQLGIGLNFTLTREGLTTDPKGSLNPAFPHFTLDPALESMLAEVPPLVAPFGEADWGPAHAPLLFQRIGGITTAYPLLTVAQTSQGRSMVLLGEGSWRWRQVGYLRTDSHERFNELVGKLTQYLTSDPGVDRFRVDGPRLLDEDQRLNFQARVYDATLQPLQGADISLQMTDSAGASYDYRFSSSNPGRYSLDAGRLPKGTYNWTAQTDIAEKAFRRSGTVAIRGIQLERNGRPAQHDALRRMAEQTGGTTFSSTALKDLTQALTDSGQFVPELRLSERLQDLIGWKTLLYILTFLLAAEWAIRRWAGTY